MTLPLRRGPEPSDLTQCVGCGREFWWGPLQRSGDEQRVKECPWCFHRRMAGIAPGRQTPLEVEA